MGCKQTDELCRTANGFIVAQVSTVPTRDKRGHVVAALLFAASASRPRCASVFPMPAVAEKAELQKPFTGHIPIPLHKHDWTACC
jgi:hypothetical protein